MDHRKAADSVSYEIIRQKQVAALGHEEPFTIERPGDVLRRQLIVGQRLPSKSNILPVDEKQFSMKHWPDPDYFDQRKKEELPFTSTSSDVFQLTLMEALKIGAQNSLEYQTQKEEIFRAALNLDLAQDEFRTSFNGQVEYLYSVDRTDDPQVKGHRTTGDIGVAKALKSGVKFTSAFAVDLANLLTSGGASALGIVGDASVSIPLLQGFGKHIAGETLTQAERNVVYEIYAFERYKRTFAVSIAKSYLSVLTLEDKVNNNEENYRSLIRSARRARRRADAGLQTEIQVDQAVQDELRARDRWITSQDTYQRSLDDFKILLGLPPDARIALNRGELDRLKKDYGKRFAMADEDTVDENSKNNESATGESIVLIPPDRAKAGPFEIEADRGIRIAFNNRLDLQAALGKFYDAQRKVVVLADALGAEISLLGEATLGESRLISSATMEDATLNTANGYYTALLTLDLPIERTSERNAYRKGLIDMEQALRDGQKLEDDIKRDVRSKLGDLLVSRESIGTQFKSVQLAQKRVNMTQMFLEAGRTQIRDLLEAQSALLTAQNALTSAVANYRIAELELQRDMGVLVVSYMGLWQEYVSEKE